MDGDELAEDVAVADHELGRLALVFEVLRRQTNRRERIELGGVADERAAVDHRGRADAAILPEHDVGANDGMRPDDGARADARAWVDVRGRIDPRLVVHREHELRLRHELPSDLRGRAGAHDRTAPPIERHLELEPIAGHDLPAEFRVVDAAQRHAARRQQQRRHLGERLDHQHRRHQRRAGKMPLEELFVDGDVLDRHDPPTGLLLGDVVHEKRGIPGGETLDGAGDGQGVVHNH